MGSTIRAYTDEPLRGVINLSRTTVWDIPPSSASLPRQGKQAKDAAGEGLSDGVTRTNTRVGAIDPAAWTDEEKTASTAAREDLREGSNAPPAGAEKRGQNFSCVVNNSIISSI